MDLSLCSVFSHELPHGSWCVLLAAAAIVDSTTRTPGFQGHCVSWICHGTLLWLAVLMASISVIVLSSHPALPPLSRCWCTNTCQILAIIALWGLLRVRNGQVYNLNRMGLNFQVVILNLLVITLVQISFLPSWKKLSPKNIWTSSSYWKRTYCWWFKCKGTRNIWITFPSKWAWSSKSREWMNYLAISTVEVVSIKELDR